MIVVCTTCQAKFKVADEKVGPRGAKVRCSKCQTVFLVHRDLGSVPLEAAAPAPRVAAHAQPPAPAMEIDLEPGRRGPAPSLPSTPDPFAGVDPFAAPAASPGVPSLDDPFAVAAATAPPAPRAATADPFAAVLGAAPTPSPDSDPFGGALPGSGDYADPFTAPPARTPPPMSATPPPIASPGALPVTDLSDLMGGLVEPPPPPDGETSDPDFALEARSAPRPRVSALEAATEAAEVNVAAAAASRQEQQFYQEAGEEPLKLATEQTDPPPGRALAPAPSEVATPVRGTAAAPAPVTPAPRPRPRAPGASDAEAELAARTLAQTLPKLRRASRIRKVLLNAFALVVLVLLAAALLLLVQSRGKLEPGALRPSAVLRALGGQPPGAFGAVEVASGAYERGRGPPLLFVRGRAVSRAAAPVRALAVSVEVVLRGEVVARGQAIAGAVPTAEELHGVADAAALSQVVRAAEVRAPAAVSPGQEIPFLVAIADYPADVAGAALRVSVAEAPGGGP